MLKKWNELPDYMKCDEVREYYDLLEKRKTGLLFKRIFDFVMSFVLLILLAVPMVFIAICILVDSAGPVFYRQERVTIYGKRFKIHKFRTMVVNADKMGAAVTVEKDNRITKVGAILRKYRLDEFPQIFDVLSGNMSFVGTRPEVIKYVNKYKPEYFATLLLPAGITSEASIRYKDEARLLEKTGDIDRVYIEEVLPKKMEYNLKAVKDFSFFAEFYTLVRTVRAVLGRNY